MSQSTKGAHLQLSVFRQFESVKVINLETLDGIDGDVLAYGFTANGIPVTNKKAPSTYKVTGGVVGGVNLNSTFNFGCNMDSKRGINNELEQGKRLQSWEAVALMLSRYGLPANPTEIRKQTEELIKNGVNAIHYAKLSNLCGMPQSYGQFDDSWMVMGSIPPVDYDLEFNPLLQRLKSPWRIQTPKTMKALHALTLRKLMATA
jgi:hypothetical protein